MYYYIYIYIYIFSIQGGVLAVLLGQKTAPEHGKFPSYVNKSREDPSETLDIYHQY